jgi:DNA-binding response OmpR family regulator
METKANLLLVEDDRNLGYILSEYLGMKGFTVTWVQDGKEAVSLISKNIYSLCILDVMLPSLDGFDIARHLSASTFTIPFIFLTAKTLKVDRLKGFALGCDDYILKPVDEEELVARIYAVLKRTATPKLPEQQNEIKIGGSLFHPATQVVETAGIKTKLTAKEAEVLVLLINHKNNLLDRETALKKVWGSNDYFNRRSMDVIISRLRKHLSTDPAVKITNIHGKGYILSDDNIL